MVEALNLFVVDHARNHASHLPRLSTPLHRPLLVRADLGKEDECRFGCRVFAC